jgi:rubrerythrin
LVSRPKAGLTQQTLNNLTTAMRGEAFAYTKYLLFAEHAQQAGNTRLGNLFEQTAKTERFQHFREEAQLAGLVGSDAENLKDAVARETSEIDSMYLRFALESEGVNDFAAAKLFREVRNDERVHRDAFQEELGKLQMPATGN